MSVMGFISTAQKHLADSSLLAEARQFDNDKAPIDLELTWLGYRLRVLRRGGSLPDEGLPRELWEVTIKDGVRLEEVFGSVPGQSARRYLTRWTVLTLGSAARPQVAPHLMSLLNVSAVRTGEEFEEEPEARLV